MDSYNIELWLPFKLPELLQKLPLEEKCHFQASRDNDASLKLVGQHMNDGLFRLLITGSEDFKISDSDIRCHISDCSVAVTSPTPVLQPPLDKKQSQTGLPTVSPRKSSRIKEKHGDCPNVTGVLKSYVRKKRKRTGSTGAIEASEKPVSVTSDEISADANILNTPSSPDSNEACVTEMADPTGTNSSMSIDGESDGLTQPASENVANMTAKREVHEQHEQRGSKKKIKRPFKSKNVKNKGHSLKPKSSGKSNLLNTKLDYLLSKEAKEKLLKYSFTCKICPNYTAVLDGTFKAHIKAKHNMTAAEYKKYTSEHQAQGDSQSTQHCSSSKVSKFKDTGSNKVKDTASSVGVEGHGTDDCMKPKKKKYRKYDKESQENVFKCVVCDNGYRSKDSLIYHLKNTHSGEQQAKEWLIMMKEENWNKVVTDVQTECPYCKCLYSGTRVLSHLRLKHVEESDFQEQYGMCQKTVKAQRYAKTRQKTLVSEACVHCHKMIKKCSMKRHITNHCKANPNVIKRYDCHWCGFYSLDKNVMTQHKMTKHNNIEPKGFVCDICGLSYNTPSGLREHGRIKHGTFSKKKLVFRVCPVCGKECPTKSVYTRHVASHSSETPYSCEICNKGFKDKCSYSLHNRTVHQGQYKFHCDKCGHGMRKAANLKVHQCDRVRRKSVKIEQAEGMEASSSDFQRDYAENAVYDQLPKVEVTSEELSENATNISNMNVYENDHTDFSVECSGLADGTLENSENVFIVLENSDDKPISQDTLKVATLTDGSCVIVVPKGDTAEGVHGNEIYTVVESMETPGHILMDINQ